MEYEVYDIRTERKFFTGKSERECVEHIVKHFPPDMKDRPLIAIRIKIGG